MRKYNVTVNGKTYEVEIEEAGRGHIRPAASYASPAPAATAAAQVPAAAAAPAPAAAPAAASAAAVTAQTEAAAADTGSTDGAVTSGITGKVFKIEANAGQSVQAGDTIIILEAMKMEIPVVAPKAGTVDAINVAEGDPVENGQVLAIIK